jgi:hypothetical protein
VLSDADRAVVAAAAQSALAWLDVTAVRLADVIDAGSARSVVVRALADRRSGEPVEIVIKLTRGSIDGFVRERAALSVIADHGLPGAVHLLGWCDEPPLVVLEDLGDGASVADLLLADDAEVAERAVIDWATTVGQLQAASAGLGDKFRARLTRPARVGVDASGPRQSLAPADLLADWLLEAAETLEGLLRPLGVRPSATALAELQAIASMLDPSNSAATGLVAGDTCPDNALYAHGQLTLIDFEAAAHRPVAWEAAYLLVPWPTCWCSWALPDQVARRALGAWQESVAPAIPAVTANSFADELARAVIAWTFVSLTFLAPRAIAEPTAEPRASSTARPGPDHRSLIMHRMQVAAGYQTDVSPALRDFAGQVHDACVHRWSQHNLEVAPAFRAVR